MSKENVLIKNNEHKHEHHNHGLEHNHKHHERKHHHEQCCGHDHKHDEHHHHEHEHNHEHCCGHDHKHHEHKHEHCHEHSHSHEHCCGHHHEHGHHSCHCHDSGCMCGQTTIKPLIIRLAISIVIYTLITFTKINDILPSFVNIIILVAMYMLISIDVLKTAIKSILKKNIFSETLLVTIATIGAFIIGEYLEAIAVVFLYQLGEYLQDKASDNSKKKILETLNLKSSYANLVENDTTSRVDPSLVNIGDTILVKPGEKVALDGVVIKGSSFLDTSSLTGEFVPRKADIGDEVLSGYINKDSILHIKVTNTYKDSTANKILELIENASEKKSKTENFISKFARVYTPIVVGLAVLLAILPPIIIGNYDFSTWIYKACGFLVASCPCALVISIPLGFLSGIGCASKHGIIVKGSNYLDALSKTKSLVFDKTGTLTKGDFSIQQIDIYDNTYNKEEILKLSAHVENMSTHPLAKSIVAEYEKETLTTPNSSDVTDYKEIKGRGLSANYDNKHVLIGNKALLEDNNIAINISNDSESKSHGYIYIAINNKHIANILLSDTIKEDSKKAIQELKELGIDVHMLTGDHSHNAYHVSDKLDINKENVHTNLLPNDKVTHLEKLIIKEHKTAGNVVYTGDGINDAPVLTRADVGIAMGGLGSDSALESSDCIIMTDEPSKIPSAIKIAKKTMQVVKENIIGSLTIKAVVLVLLAIGISSMWLAVFADVGVFLLAIANSLRLIHCKV